MKLVPLLVILSALSASTAFASPCDGMIREMKSAEIRFNVDVRFTFELKENPTLLARYNDEVSELVRSVASEFDSLDPKEKCRIQAWKELVQTAVAVAPYDMASEIESFLSDKLKEDFKQLFPVYQQVVNSGVHADKEQDCKRKLVKSLTLQPFCKDAACLQEFESGSKFYVCMGYEQDEASLQQDPNVIRAVAGGSAGARETEGKFRATKADCKCALPQLSKIHKN